MTLAGFDQNFYLEEKLSALQQENAALWADKDTEYLNALFTGVYGVTAETHYSLYGYAEGLSPNAYFNADEYKQAKAAQLFETGQYASLASALDTFNILWPYDPYLHYLYYGAAEGINPSNDFDESDYLSAKLAALQTYSSTQPDWAGKTVDDLRSYLASIGMTALDHYLDYGQYEGLSVTAVSGDERVTLSDSSSGSQDTGGSVTLTIGSDTLTGDETDNTFNGAMTNNLQTLNSGDTLDGKEGMDTLFGQLSNTAIVVPTVADVEVLQLNATVAGGATYDANNTTGIEKIENLQSSSSLTVTHIADSLTSGLLISNAGASTYLNFDNSALTGDSDNLVITLDGVYGDETVIRAGSEADPNGDIERLTIKSSGGASDLGIGYIDMNEVSLVTIIATAQVDLGTTAAFEAMTELDASSSTAGVTLTLANKISAGTDVSLTGGSGSDYFDVSAMDENADLTVDLGDGDDTIVVAKDNVRTDWTIDGGDGTNVVQTDKGITMTDVFSNFQGLAFKGSSEVIQDMDNLRTSITSLYIGVDGDQAVTVTNIDEGDVVTLTADKTGPDGAAVTLQGDTGVNTISLILDDEADQGIDVDDPDGGVVIDTNIQKINLVTTTNETHSLNLNGSSSLAEIQISGGGDLDLRGVDDTIALNDTTTYVNAESATGSVYVIAGASDTKLTGGSSDDDLTGGAGDDTITGNQGNDILAGGAGLNTLTGGDGADSILCSGTDVVILKEMTDGGSLTTLTSLTTDVDDLTVSKADDINGFTSGTDKISIQSDLADALNAIGTVDDEDTEFTAATDAFNFNTATVFIIGSSVGTADIGDISALTILFNDTLSAGKENAASGQEIIFTAENTSQETGLYYFSDTDGNGKISEGDTMALLGVVDTSLANGDFSF